MREEITEPKHWRATSDRPSQRNNSWTSRRRAQQHTELAAEAVDMAIADVCQDSDNTEPIDSHAIVANLASQLDLLEKQREHLQRLLDQAQGQ